MKKTIMEFSGSPEMLIALLYSDDVCQTIKDEVRASGKVTMFVFAESDAETQSDVGQPCQVEDDLHWDEHHEARIDRIGQNGGDGAHYSADRGDDAEVVGT